MMIMWGIFRNEEDVHVLSRLSTFRHQLNCISLSTPFKMTEILSFCSLRVLRYYTRFRSHRFSYRLPREHSQYTIPSIVRRATLVFTRLSTAKL